MQESMQEKYQGSRQESMQKGSKELGKKVRNKSSSRNASVLFICNGSGRVPRKWTLLARQQLLALMGLSYRCASTLLN